MKLTGIAVGKQKVGRTYDFDVQEPSLSSPSIIFPMDFR